MVPLGSYSHVGNSYSFRLQGGNALYSLLISLAYYVGLEVWLGGTLGKLAMGMRVVMDDGSRITPGASLVRNLLRIVDAFPYFVPYLVGAIAIWTDKPRRRRLGDRVAKTVVIAAGSNVPPAPPGSGLPASWGVREAPPVPQSPPIAQPPAGTPPMPPPPAGG